MISESWWRKRSENESESMDDLYVTYVANEHFDSHDYDDNTDSDHDNNNDIYGHISMIYRWYSQVVAML